MNMTLARVQVGWSRLNRYLTERRAAERAPKTFKACMHDALIAFLMRVAGVAFIAGIAYLFGGQAP